MEWYMFLPALWYRLTRGMNSAEKGDYMDKTVDALVDEARGETPLADAMLAEAEAFIGKKRDAGRLGGLAKARNAAIPSTAKQSLAPLSTATKNVAPLSTPMAPLSTPLAKSSHTYIQTDTHTDKPIIPPVKPPPSAPPATATPPAPPRKAVLTERTAAQPEAARSTATQTPTDKPDQPREVSPALPTVVPIVNGDKISFRWGEFAADKYGYLNRIAWRDLPAFAAWFCGEPDNKLMRGFCERFIRKHGQKVLRRYLESFIGECQSGEEPHVRGAAFVARLRKHETDAQAAGTDGNGGGNAP